MHRTFFFFYSLVFECFSEVDMNDHKSPSERNKTSNLQD